MRLPDTLQPWAPWLIWFDAEIAGVLGDLLLRLHPALGAFRLRAQRGAAEPEGIEDLRRRGSYERLLLSEWALADAAPEEFDRRAAGGEHLFLNPKPVARQVDALTVAVFDAGPSQLGASRLVHAALWILLAQRAQAAGARFLWGVLARPGELQEADSPAALKRLLSARSLTPGGAASARASVEQGADLGRDLQAQWAQALDAAEPSPSERWSVGAHAPGYALGHRVDVVRADADELAVTVAARQARRELRLRLPDPEPSSRLLRGEFERLAASRQKIPAHARLSRQQPPIIAADGRSVATLWAGENAAYVQRLSPPHQSQRLLPPKTARWAKHRHLLAACLSGRHFAGVLTRSQFLDPWQLARWPGLPHPLPQHLNAAPGQARLMQCAEIAGNDDEQRHLLLWSGSRLLCWSARHPRNGRRCDRPGYRLIGENVLGFVALPPQRAFYLQGTGEGVQVRRFDGAGVETLESLPCDGEAGAGFLCGNAWGDRWQGDIAVEFAAGQRGGERHGRWRLWRRSPSQGLQDFELALSAAWKVVGLAAVSADAPALIALDPDRKAVVRIGERGRTTLYASPQKISVASVAAAADTIALIDVSGRLTILRHQGRDVLVYEGGDD
ncbi:hypothetical protein [Lysobacter antibioticus]|uniref:hypothetical protein n=1 Tax=Lysobacter antibioticus TaxID=84531 RepID=UPI00034DA447|nr:hypothetical protein [Lysobacter antibioticus]